MGGRGLPLKTSPRPALTGRLAAAVVALWLAGDALPLPAEATETAVSGGMSAPLSAPLSSPLSAPLSSPLKPVTEGTLWQRYNEYGKNAYGKGQLIEAARWFREANRAASQANVDDVRLATIYSNLAVVYRDMGKYPAAEILFKRALEIKTRSLPPTDSSLASTTRHYAVLLRKTDRDDEARMLEARTQILADARLRGTFVTPERPRPTSASAKGRARSGVRFRPPAPVLDFPDLLADPWFNEPVEAMSTVATEPPMPTYGMPGTGPSGFNPRDLIDPGVGPSTPASWRRPAAFGVSTNSGIRGTISGAGSALDGVPTFPSAPGGVHHFGGAMPSVFSPISGINPGLGASGISPSIGGSLPAFGPGPSFGPTFAGAPARGMVCGGPAGQR